MLRDTALFLHRSAGPVLHAEEITEHIVEDDIAFLHNKKILLVDDDYRNVFALSKILTERGMQIIKAENGLVALEKLNSERSIELVLMDIMMPEMDGYEAMRILRSQERFKHLPVIAVTAKAMSYDQQKCLEAGANNYITKPVEIEKLLSMMVTLLRRAYK
jgi:CheY-like chemotaxis protein